MLTEKDAGQVRCCGPEGCGYENNNARFCIGSQCMAWRFGKHDFWRYPSGKMIPLDKEPQSGAGHWVKVGYCGLAGAPS